MSLVSSRAYLDYNATAPLRREVRDAMMLALDLVGNPSSGHFEGRAARAAIEKARMAVASLVGGLAKNVIFTSGGTEAANLALTPHIQSNGDKGGFSQLAMSAVEHACVLKGHRFPTEAVTVLPVKPDGRLDLAALQNWLEALNGVRPLLALQYANNETGVLQPVRAAADLIHAHGGLLICDAVQAAGKLPVSFEASGADMFLLSAHKLGGPKGVGAVVLAREGLHIAAPLLNGGGQEKGARAGTQNVAAISGFGVAADLALGELPQAHEGRDQLIADILSLAPDAIIFGQEAPRLPNTICFAVPDTQAETLLIGFDLAGVALSSGSACSSGKVAVSHVLQAMGIPNGLAKGALRISFGWASRAEDFAHFKTAFSDIMKKLSERRGKFAA
eukprot:gene16279-16458_t